MKGLREGHVHAAYPPAGGPAQPGVYIGAPAPRRRPAAVVVVLALVAAVGGFAAYRVTGSGPAAPSPSSVVVTPTRTATSDPNISPVAPYREAIEQAGRRNLRVWLEIDLVKRWQQGRAAFDAGVARIAELSLEPNVVGVKVADELGYQDGMTSATKILAFLRDTSTAVRAAAPGKKILIDMLVPELGCLPGLVPPRIWPSVAATDVVGRYPQLALDEVDSYVRSKTFDVLDVSSYLHSAKTYAGWGTDRDTAQRLAWQEVQRRGWADFVTLQARKAFAAPGGFQGSSGEAAADARTWLDLPVQGGAQAVDAWTWAQRYKGQVNALLAGDLASNPLWTELLARHRRGVRLFTHFTPSITHLGVGPDLDRLAQVFTDVFMATGTG